MRWRTYRTSLIWRLDRLRERLAACKGPAAVGAAFAGIVGAAGLSLVLFWTGTPEQAPVRFVGGPLAQSQSAGAAVVNADPAPTLPCTQQTWPHIAPHCLSATQPLRTVDRAGEHAGARRVEDTPAPPGSGATAGTIAADEVSPAAATTAAASPDEPRGEREPFGAIGQSVPLPPVAPETRRHSAERDAQAGSAPIAAAALGGAAALAAAPAADPQSRVVPAPARKQRVRHYRPVPPHIVIRRIDRIVARAFRLF